MEWGKMGGWVDKRVVGWVDWTRTCNGEKDSKGTGGARPPREAAREPLLLSSSSSSSSSSSLVDGSAAGVVGGPEGGGGGGGGRGGGGGLCLLLLLWVNHVPSFLFLVLLFGRRGNDRGGQAQDILYQLLLLVARPLA